VLALGGGQFLMSEAPLYGADLPIEVDAPPRAGPLPSPPSTHLPPDTCSLGVSLVKIQDFGVKNWSKSVIFGQNLVKIYDFYASNWSMPSLVQFPFRPLRRLVFLPIPAHSESVCSGSEASSYLRRIDFCIT